MTDRDLDRAVSALHSIPNDLSGDDWLRPSIAAKAAGIPFDDWHAWCSGASNYKGEADCRVRWKSFDINGPIQAGTLFKAAGDNGWREGTGKPPRPAPARATRGCKPEPPKIPSPGFCAKTGGICPNGVYLRLTSRCTCNCVQIGAMRIKLTNMLSIFADSLGQAGIAFWTCCW